MKKNFAIIGCGGYIAPRHLKAIKETGNSVIAALDKTDSVGLLDGYFDDVHFFTEFERFDRHAEKLRRKGEEINADPILVERVIYAFELLGLLIKSDIELVFKGGTSLILAVPGFKRLSIDLDVVIETEIESLLPAERADSRDCLIM